MIVIIQFCISIVIVVTDKRGDKSQSVHESLTIAAIQAVQAFTMCPIAASPIKAGKHRHQLTPSPFQQLEKLKQKLDIKKPFSALFNKSVKNQQKLQLVPFTAYLFSSNPFILLLTLVCLLPIFSFSLSLQFDFVLFFLPYLHFFFTSYYFHSFSKAQGLGEG